MRKKRSQRFLINPLAQTKKSKLCKTAFIIQFFIILAIFHGRFVQRTDNQSQHIDLFFIFLNYDEFTTSSLAIAEATKDNVKVHVNKKSL